MARLSGATTSPTTEDQHRLPPAEDIRVGAYSAGPLMRVIKKWEINGMVTSSGLSRREALKIALPLTSAVSLAAASPGAQGAPSGSKILVAYFTRTGNTRVIARQIRRARETDLFEIGPAEPYPEDYEATVSQAQRERDTRFEPPLRSRVSDFDSYEMVFVGFPIWGMTAPPVIRSFLSVHDMSGKILVPFITHGGYGVGQSLSVLAEHAPSARLLDGFSMEADQERETLTQVTGWLGRIQIDR